MTIKIVDLESEILGPELHKLTITDRSQPEDVIYYHLCVPELTDNNVTEFVRDLLDNDFLVCDVIQSSRLHTFLGPKLHNMLRNRDVLLYFCTQFEGG